MNVIKKIIRFILKTALGLAVFLLLYGLIVFITSIIPVNKNKSLDNYMNKLFCFFFWLDNIFYF